MTLTSGQASNCRSFANTQRVLINGNVFNDQDASGAKNTGDGNLASWRVFLDSDKNGVWDSTEPSTLTDASGNYKFTQPAGSYRVRVVQPATGWRRTTPNSGYFDLSLTSGATATSRNFGFTQKALISGNVFNDANNNRLRDNGEAGLSNWRVFIDANNDGLWQSTEANRLSDASGNWSFNALSAGTYVVRVVQQSGWSRTTPSSGSYSLTLSAAQLSTGKVFGERRIA